MLGGSRSGKSGFAEALLADAAAVDYLATAAGQPDDAEWTARIALHRERRPASWRTLETVDVAAVLASDGPPLLVDSITTWLARTMDGCGAWNAPSSGELDSRIDGLCAAWAATGRRVVAVSDEVGSGIIPPSESGRRFRDALGLLNQRLAAVADEVQLVVAGLPLRLR